MKIIIISLVIAATCFTAHAGKYRWQYVITNSDTLICKNIMVGNVSTKCVLLSGKKMVISNKDINVIGKSAVKGKSAFLMEKKPLCLNNKFTGENVLMELIDVHDGIWIYKYDHYNRSTGSIDLLISFYKRDKFINTQTNPYISQVYDYVNHYNNCNCKYKELLRSNQLTTIKDLLLFMWNNPEDPAGSKLHRFMVPAVYSGLIV